MNIITVPDSYSDPMEAVRGGLAINGIPNSWMVANPGQWVVVSYVDGEEFDRATVKLTDWIAQNGEPDSASLLKGESK